MALATVDADGLPDVRMVLLKGFDERGFVFYTNLDSQKGRELDRNPKAALLFHWKSRNRQVRLRGPVERVSDAEADAYFATRARLAQIGAWASKQSAPLESRLAFEKAIALYTAKFAIGTRAAAAELVGLSARSADASSSGRTGRSACTTASNSAAQRRARPGARRGSIRELVSTPRSAEVHSSMPTTQQTNQPRRTLLLTGASRGIGHATVKRFSAAGWRVITCSRHPFPENCPWEAGPEDHIQVDLADPDEHRRTRSPRSSSG